MARASPNALAQLPHTSVVLLSAYREFEQRVGVLTTTGGGAKMRRVLDALQRLPLRFRLEDVQRACSAVSDSALRKTLIELRKKGRLIAGRGANAYWTKTETFGATPIP